MFLQIDMVKCIIEQPNNKNKFQINFCNIVKKKKKKNRQLIGYSIFWSYLLTE